MELEEAPSGQQEAGAPLFDEAKRFILLSLENARTKRPPPPPTRNQIQETLISFDDRPRHIIFWDFLSENLKQDRDIAFAAFVFDHARAEDLPEQIRQDRSFFLEAVRKRSSCWYSLSEEHKRDPEFVRNFTSFVSDNLVAAVFEAIPTLRNDRNIWKTIIASNSSLSINRKFEMAPISILSDRELMMKACGEEVSSLCHVSEVLAMDKKFLQQVIDMNPDALHWISHNAQLQFPDILIDNLERFFALETKRSGGNLLHFVAPDLRANPSFAEAWFTLGGSFERKFFPESFRDNVKIFLWLAENGPDGSFEHASDRLKNDYAFVSRVIELKPQSYWFISNEMKRHFCFLVKALAGSTSFAEDYAEAFVDVDRGRQRYQDICSRVEQRIDLYEAFFASILLGISLPADPSHCPLTILNQGNETSLVYKKLIAEYAGVPIQKDLLMPRMAIRNLRLAQKKLGLDDNLNHEIDSDSSEASGEDMVVDEE